MADDESDSDSTLADVPWFARGSKASQRPPKGQPGELLFEFNVPAYIQNPAECLSHSRPDVS